MGTACRPVVVDNGTMRPSTVGDNVNEQKVITQNTADSNQTMTAAQLLDGGIVRTGLTAGRTDTFDTAANLISALPQYNIGDTITSYIANHSGQTITLAAGTGNTLVGTASFPTGTNRKVVVQITSATTCTIFAI